MRFHAILVIRDEADIVTQCLEHTLSWCDAVYVYDTGSCDQTWEIVLDYAGREPRIVPCRKESVVFTNGLRAYVFDRFRRRAEDGDWFLRIDADEFYHITPREFVRSHVRAHETCIYAQHFDFRLTEQDVAAWQDGRETLADRDKPIESRRRSFFPLLISEPRMFRYRRTMQWSPECSFPYNAGYVAEAKLPIRHYPHRDPVQLQHRCMVRSMTYRALQAQEGASPDGEYKHWQPDEWSTFVVRDDADGLLRWEPGAPLPIPAHNGHLADWRKRVLQRAAHATLLPVLDRTRPKFPSDFQPRYLPQLSEQTSAIVGSHM